MNNKPNLIAVMLRHEASTGDGNLSISTVQTDIQYLAILLALLVLIQYY